MKPQLLIFSLEGVLVESTRLWAEARAQALKAAGVAIEADELIEDYGGAAFKDILLKLEERAQVPLQASLLGAADTVLDRRLSRELRATEDARDMLARLPTPFCAVSDEPTARVEKMLGASGLEKFLAGRVFSSPAEELKPRPAPDLLRFAAEKAKAAPENCFVIDATAAGVAAAKAAGMRAVGFSGGENSYPGLADRLTEAGAETVLRRLSALAPTLAALSDWSDPG